MKDFTFSIPQNIIVGVGSLNKLGSLALEMKASRALIISDHFLDSIGLVNKCKDILNSEGIEVESFLDVEGNPSVETVEKAKEVFVSTNSDFIVALGGGSAMDVAKAVGVVAKYGGSIIEYEGGGKVPGPIVPQIAIPTTAGTGSEVTAFSVITDHSRDYKLTVFSYELLPKYALLDPSLITTVPASVAASCGMDAFIHALESYISTDASYFSEAMSQKAMELIGRSIRGFVANRANVEAASDMMVGSLLAGIAFSWARLGNVHAMSHPVSAYFNVAHGVANSILLPTILDYNKLADNGKYRIIYDYISTVKSDDSFTSDMLVEEIRNLNKLLGIPANLTEVGVSEDKIELMAKDAMKSGNILVNPRSSTLKDIIELYHKAM